MKKIIIMALMLCLSSSIFAQSKTELRLTLRDGSLITGTTKMDKMLFTTAYGKLEIPVKNISHLKLGIPEDASQKANVVNLLKQLNNASEATRKNAYENIVKLSSGAIPVIENVMYSDASVASGTYADYTAEAALSELKSMHGIEEGMTVQDVVTIDGEFTIGGRYEFSKIDLTTEYGSLSIPREKIRSMDILYSDGTNQNEKNFKLLASKHISSNKDGGWLKTGIMVKTGQKINISANGQVTLASLSGASYKPDGKVVSSSTGLAGDDYYDSYDGGSSSTYPVYGNVVFKIGESGPVQKAGAKFNGTAKQSGMLHISIYETVYNAANSGSYNVNVSVK
jgi:hypothetical protein